MNKKILFYLASFFLLLSLNLTGCASSPALDNSAHSQKPLTVFLVRHAEKTSESQDPELTVAGEVRAAQLASLLRSADIQFIHSSDYVRTKQTAAPLAALLTMDVRLYDPRDLPGMSETLKASGGRHLVVGHSNTTPVLVELLGGDPVSEIDEKSEYDRLYFVSVAEDGSATSVLIRFGQAYVENKLSN